MTSPYLRRDPEEIEGIGPAFGASLRVAGITTLGDLLRRGADRIPHAVEGVSRERAARWVASARLMRLDSVGPDLAEALVDAGIDTLGRLADSSLRTLERATHDAHARGRLREVPSLYALADVMRDAAAAAGTGPIEGTIRTDGGAPVPGARIAVAGRTTSTDAAGGFELRAVPAGSHRLRVAVDGRPDCTIRVSIAADRVGPPVELGIQAATPDLLPAPRSEQDGAVVRLGPGGRLDFETVALGDLPEGAPLAVVTVPTSGTALLVHLAASQRGSVVHAQRIRVDPAALPAQVRVSDVLTLVGGRLVPAGQTLRERALSQFDARYGVRTLRTVSVSTRSRQDG